MPLSGASKEGWMARMLRTMDDASMSGGRLELKLCRGLSHLWSLCPLRCCLFRQSCVVGK